MSTTSIDNDKRAELLGAHQSLMASLVSASGVPFEDGMQEARIALLSAYAHYDPSIGTPFGAYARICIRNRLSAYAKGEQRARMTHEPIEDMPDVGLSPEDQLIEAEEIASRKAWMKTQLTALEYAVWRLYVDHYTYKEIAVILSNEKRAVTTKTVNNALQRVRRKVKR